MLKFLLSVFILPFSFLLHPFYMSVSDLKYSDEDKALQGTIKIFTNDLEEALARATGKRPDLVNARDDKPTRELLLGYLVDHFSVIVNGNKLKMSVLGFEREEEATWIYVQMNNCTKPEKITIHNKILCDHLPQQVNIVHLQVDTQQKSLKALCSDPVLNFDF